MPASAAARLPRPDNRRSHVLDAAARHFRERGYDGASMRDIARDAGMLAGSMYYHFASKEDLLLAVHEEGVRRISAAVQSAIRGLHDPWQRLEAAACAHLRTLLDGGDYAVVVIRELPRDIASRRKLVALRDCYETVFRELVADLALPAGVDRRTLRLMLLGALNWAQTWYRPGGESPETIARRFVGLLRRPLSTEARP